MSDSRRAAFSERGKKNWNALSEEKRAARLAKGRAAYAEKYPERFELSNRTREQIEAGDITPLPCVDCGGMDAQPEYDYAALQVAGWSHYACRKRRGS